MSSEPVALPPQQFLDKKGSLPAFPPEVFEPLAAVEDRHFWFMQRNRMIGEWLFQYVPDIRKARMLEVGCGNGTVLAYLHKMGLQVAGVDLYHTALTRCRKRVRVPLFQADAAVLPFRDGFEVVGLFDCLEHFDNPERVLAEAWRTLAPNGHLLVTVPAVSALYGWVDRLSGHRLRFSRPRLAALLASNGFKVLRASYFMALIFPALVVSRALAEWRYRKTPDSKKPLVAQFQVPWGVNSLFGWACTLDRLALHVLELPVGGSLIAVARKV